MCADSWSADARIGEVIGMERVRKAKSSVLHPCDENERYANGTDE